MVFLKYSLVMLLEKKVVLCLCIFFVDEKIELGIERRRVFKRVFKFTSCGFLVFF